MADGKKSRTNDDAPHRRTASPALHPLHFSCRRADRNELLRDQRGTADEAAVYIGHGEQFLRVRGFDAPAVDDAQPGGQLCILPGDDAAYERVHRLGLLRRRGPAGADRPHWLVGDHRIDQRADAARIEHSDPARALAETAAELGLAEPARPDTPEALYNAERALLDGFRVIPLFHLPRVFGAGPRVKGGPGITPLGEWHFENLWVEDRP